MIILVGRIVSIPLLVFPVLSEHRIDILKCSVNFIPHLERDRQYQFHKQGEGKYRKYGWQKYEYASKILP